MYCFKNEQTVYKQCDSPSIDSSDVFARSVVQEKLDTVPGYIFFKPQCCLPGVSGSFNKCILCFKKIMN